MDSAVRSVSLTYGDAQFSFWSVRIPPSSVEEDVPSQHSHAFYEIHMIKKGPLTYHLSDAVVSVRTGDALLVPPHTLHGCGADLTDRVPVAFSLKKAESGEKYYDIFKEALDTHTLCSFPFADYQNGEMLTKSDLYRSFAGKLQLQAAAASFLCHLFTRLVSDCTVSADADRDVLLIIDEYIYRQHCTLDEIAAATNYSKRHLSRLIKKQYGSSLSELRRNLKELG